MNNGNGNGASRTLGRVDFAALRKSKIIRVDFPELGGHYNLMRLSGGQVFRDFQAEDKDNIAKQLAHAIVDDDFNRIYSDSEEDLANINEMPADIFGALVEKLNELHGRTKAVVDETVKNSETGQNTASASA
jgi:hypothetical protein